MTHNLSAHLPRSAGKSGRKNDVSPYTCSSNTAMLRFICLAEVRILEIALIKLGWWKYIWLGE